MPSKSLCSHCRRSDELRIKESPQKHHKISKAFPILKLKQKKSPKKSPTKNQNSTDLQPFKGDSLFNNLFKETFPFDGLIPDPFTEPVGNPIEEVIEEMNQEIEEELNLVEDMIEHPPKLEDPEHTSCFMKVVTNNNGHVKVKALKKSPGSDWEKYTQEYTEKRPALIKDKKRDKEKDKKELVSIESK